jgi:RNA polymerase sigma-70 factor (ECF subfamily)
MNSDLGHRLNYNDAPLTSDGFLEARYRAFLATITQLRPRLHRYCSRMSGSVLDGEDIVQEALFEAYRKLASFDESRPLEPWLFRIAHNRCIDFLRRRGVRERAEWEAAGSATDSTPPEEPVGATLGKAALSRGRSKLATHSAQAVSAPAKKQENAELLRLYVDRFNQRDWDGLRELISADAQLQVVDGGVERMREASRYFGTYARTPLPWRMVLGEVDGEAALIVMQAADTGWTPRHAVRVRVANGQIASVTDYWFCSWLLSAATEMVMAPAL